MVVLTSARDGELWRSFPESNRSDILGLLTMLLERWACITRSLTCARPPPTSSCYGRPTSTLSPN